MNVQRYVPQLRVSMIMSIQNMKTADPWHLSNMSELNKTSSLHHISLSIKVRPLSLKQVCTELTQSVVRLRDGSKSNLVFKKQISHLEQCRHTVQVQKAYCAHHIPCGQEDDLRLRNSPRCARFLKYSFPDKPHFIRECERCIVKKNNDPCD